MRLLQACERLDIPAKLWPKIPFPQLPRQFGYTYRIGNQYAAPEFNALYESEAEWRARAQKTFEEFIEEHAARFRAAIQEDLNHKRLTAIKRTRDTTPLDLRYEWAAKRVCYRLRYREIAEGGYSEDRVKRAILKILKEADVRNGK
jgi:hypothetical protein